MIDKKIKFTDLEGQEREQKFLFHMSQAELTKLQLEVKGGFINKLKDVINRQDVPEVSKLVDMMIMNSIGEKSPNGISFIKNDRIREEFKYSDAYSSLYMELMGSIDAFSAFIKGILPSNIALEIDKAEKDGKLVTNIDEM